VLRARRAASQREDSATCVCATVVCAWAAGLHATDATMVHAWGRRFACGNVTHPWPQSFEMNHIV